jgi:hypothetical protein
MGNEADVCGGLSCCDGTIQNNTITSNTASNLGGGLGGCNGTIQNNVITNNFAKVHGGGLAYCSGTIQNNTIAGNIANDHGGGLYACNAIIQNNTITSNTASSGGGLSFCDSKILNNVITNNVAKVHGGGLSICSGIIRSGTIQNNTITSNTAVECGGGLYYCKAPIKNCIIWDNKANSEPQIADSSLPDYSCIKDWASGGTGNITDNPKFVNPNMSDYHLQDGSPCIDAGDPDAQYNDGCLPPGKGTVRNDMGAYGGPQNCGFVKTIHTDKELVDFLLGRTEALEGDLNGDGRIDVADLVLLILSK